ISVSGFLRALKRFQASKILIDLRMIDSAVDQYVIVTNIQTHPVSTLFPYTTLFRSGGALYNTGATLFGTPYGAQTVDIIPQVPSADYALLSDVAGTGFSSPYGP